MHQTATETFVRCERCMDFIPYEEVCRHVLRCEETTYIEIPYSRITLSELSIFSDAILDADRQVVVIKVK